MLIFGLLSTHIFTKIYWGTLPQRGLVTLKVFNLKGELIKQHFLGLCEFGLNQFQFDASGLESGVYFDQLLYDKQKNWGKMVLVK